MQRSCHYSPTHAQHLVSICRRRGPWLRFLSAELLFFFLSLFPLFLYFYGFYSILRNGIREEWQPWDATHRRLYLAWRRDFTQRRTRKILRLLDFSAFLSQSAAKNTRVCNRAFGPRAFVNTRAWRASTVALMLCRPIFTRTQLTPKLKTH